MMKIYYSVVEKFPTFRVDITELFGVSLKKLGVTTVWFMDASRNKDNKIVNQDGFESVKLPAFFDGAGLAVKIFNKLSYYLCDIWSLLCQLFSDVTLIQVRDKYIAALFGLLIAKIKKVPFCYWCSYPYPEHDLGMVTSLQGYRKWVYYIRGIFGYYAIYKIVMKYANHSFVQSDQMLRDIIEYGVPADKMSAVPMAVSDDIFDRVATFKTGESDKHTFVYLGTLATVRRMETIIEAFSLVVKKHPMAKLVLVGEGDYPEEKERLIQRAIALGISDSVRFTGFIPMADAWKIAANGFACISPFYPTKVLASASPTKLVEYMALGKPVIVNDQPDQASVIKSSGAGLCVEWGSEHFASAMIWMLDNPDEAIAMGRKGPEWVKENRTYSIIAGQVYQQYQKIGGDKQ